ncbi:MAG: hypothetical protein HKL96_05460 [Phycisphaerales bacterium]|nr:hypothetical protein [Phycisphaerales bacterium]
MARQLSKHLVKQPPDVSCGTIFIADDLAGLRHKKSPRSPYQVCGFIEPTHVGNAR